MWCRPGQVGCSVPLLGAHLEAMPATKVSVLLSERTEGLRKKIPLLVRQITIPKHNAVLETVHLPFNKQD